MSDTKTILVTGATDGIGTETAKRLLEEGADVYLHGRSDEKLARTAEALEKETGKTPAGTFRANYASLSEVKQMADAILARLDRLDVLLNNAGVFMNERVETEDGNEATFQINHLAPFALTLKLLPLLKASAPSRIVNVASMAHQRAAVNFNDLGSERNYDGHRAYGLSKLANILFTVELAERLKGTGVVANSLHPGVISTKLLHEGGFGGGGKLAEGAATPLHLALSEEGGKVSGEYFAHKKIADPSPAAKDRDVAKKLRRESERLTGVAFEG